MYIRNSFIAILAIITGLFIDSIVFNLMLKLYPNYNDTSVILILSCHVLASTIASLGVYVFHPEKYRIAVFIFVMTISVPLLGYLGVIQVLVSHGEEQTSGMYQEYRRHILAGSKKATHTRKAHLSVNHIQEGIELAPISEVLENEKEYTKKLVLIRNLGKITDRSSVVTLKTLLEDPHMDVRYYAGEELANIEERYNVFISELKRNVKQYPNDHRYHFELGSMLMEYAFSGLLEEEAKREELESARNHFMRSLEIDSDHVNSRILLGKLYLFFKNYQSAITNFQTAREKDEKNMDTLMGLAECYWNVKNLHLLKKCLADIETHLENYSGDNKEKIEEIMDGWRWIYANEKS